MNGTDQYVTCHWKQTSKLTIVFCQTYSSVSLLSGKIYFKINAISDRVNASFLTLVLMRGDTSGGSKCNQVSWFPAMSGSDSLL